MGCRSEGLSLGRDLVLVLFVQLFRIDDLR